MRVRLQSSILFTFGFMFVSTACTCTDSMLAPSLSFGNQSCQPTASSREKPSKSGCENQFSSNEYMGDDRITVNITCLLFFDDSKEDITLEEALTAATTGVAGDVAKLLVFKSVHDELKMTKDQINKTQDWIKNTVVTVFENLSKKNKISKVEMRKESFKTLTNILDKSQHERLKQLDLQYLGILAFEDDDVAAAFGLTDIQKSNFIKLRNNWNAIIKKEDLVSGMAFGGGGSRGGAGSGVHVGEYSAKWHKIHDEYVDKSLALLTDDQMKKWREMTGKPVNWENVFVQPKK